MANNTGSFLLGALVGAAVGGVVALLSSPRTGRENRKYVMRMAGKGQKYIQDRYEDAEEFIGDVYEEVGDQASHLMKNAEKAVKPLRHEAQKYAVRALDSVSDTAEDAKKKFFKGVK